MEIKNQEISDSRNSETKYIPRDMKLKGCCGIVTDKRMLQISAKFFVSIVVLGVSFYELMTSDECDGLNSFYIGLVSTIVSVYITDKVGKDGVKDGVKDNKK